MFEKLSVNTARPLAAYIAKHANDKKLSARSRKIIDRSLAQSLENVRQKKPNDLTSAVMSLKLSGKAWAQGFAVRATKLYRAELDALTTETSSQQASDATEFLLYDENLHGPFNTFESTNYWHRHVEEINTAIAQIRSFLDSQRGPEEQPDASPLTRYLDNGLKQLTRLLVPNAERVHLPSEYTPYLFNHTKAQLMEIVSMIGAVDDSQMALNLHALLANCQACAPGAMNALSHTLEDLKLCLSNEGEISAETLGAEYAAALQTNIETQIKALILSTHSGGRSYRDIETHYFQAYRYLLGLTNIPGLAQRPVPTDRHALTLLKRIEQNVPQFIHQLANQLSTHQQEAFNTVMSRIERRLIDTIDAHLPHGQGRLPSFTRIDETFFGQQVFPALDAVSKTFHGILRTTDLYGEHPGPDEDGLYYLKSPLFWVPHVSLALAEDPTQAFPTPYAINLDDMGSSQLKICCVSWESWVETRLPGGQRICDPSVASHLSKISPKQLRSALLAKYAHKGNRMLHYAGRNATHSLDVDAIIKNLADCCQRRMKIGSQIFDKEAFPALPVLWANIPDTITTKL